jgi:Integrase core domain
VWPVHFSSKASSLAAIGSLAPQVITAWLDTYNQQRPHRALGIMTPAASRWRKMSAGMRLHSHTPVATRTRVRVSGKLVHSHSEGGARIIYGLDRIAGGRSGR